MNAEKVVETCILNAPLIACIATLYLWATPRLIKSTLMNGGGEIVKNIVRAANAEQSLEHERALGPLRERLAVVETFVKKEKLS